MRQSRPFPSSRVALALALVFGWAVSTRVGWSAPPGGGDATVEAQRKVAAQLVKEGKADEAAGLLEPIIHSDQAGFRDFLLMAHVYEKQGRNSDAIQMYGKVLDLIPASPRNEEERLARNEAALQRKKLDPQGPKIDAAVDEFLKKLEGLRREADAAGNQVSVVRADLIHDAVARADGRQGGGTTVDVLATIPWQSSNLRVVAGQSYHVRATGVWSVLASDPAYASDADGVRNKPNFGVAPFGTLLGSIDRKDPFPLGKDATFTAKSSGVLYLQINDDANNNGLANNAGKLTVSISKE